MKNTGKLLFLLVFVLSGVTTNAQQKLKIGHINSQELLQLMPETDSAQKKLETVANDHEAIYEEMTVEFNKKMEAYRIAVQGGTLSDLARASKEAELEDMQLRIQNFEKTAQEDLQRKRVEFFTPVQEKALNAVNAVAEENGFTYIFDSGMGSIIYNSPDSQDILPLVKTKLGLK